MKNILIAMIRFYQKFLSPLKHTRCPYTPTCSQYGLRRYKNTGLLKEVFWHAGGFCDAIPFPRVVMIPFRKRVGRIKNRKLNMKNCCIMSGEYAGGRLCY